MAESIATTLLQATKNDLEFYFCFIGDAWIGKQGAFSRFPCLAEQGLPAQLLHKGGIFAHMVQLQTESQGWSLVKA